MTPEPAKPSTVHPVVPQGRVLSTATITNRLVLQVLTIVEGLHPVLLMKGVQLLLPVAVQLIRGIQVPRQGAVLPMKEVPAVLPEGVAAAIQRHREAVVLHPEVLLLTPRPAEAVHPPVLLEVVAEAVDVAVPVGAAVVVPVDADKPCEN